MHAFLAQTSPAQGCLQTLPMLVAMLAIFYFLLWRPQQKQMNEAKAFRDGLKKGDKVITAGGLLGIVQKLDGETLELEVAPKTRVRILRSQIVQYETPASGSEDGGDAKSNS